MQLNKLDKVIRKLQWHKVPSQNRVSSNILKALNRKYRICTVIVNGRIIEKSTKKSVRVINTKTKELN